MAFNFGAFAGGLAKGGMDTYSTLTDIEAKQQETKRREAEFGAWQKEQAGKEALRTAIAEQGGEKTFTPNFSGTGGMDSNDVAPTPVTQTPSQRLGGAMERAVQMGADPMAVMQYKQAARQDISADAAQKAFDWMQASDKAVAEKGLVKAAEEYLIPHYNSNKGLMNDGMNAKVVNTKVGPIVQFSDAQGNIQHNMTQPLTIKTFGQARDLVGSSMLMSSGPEHFYKGQELGIKREELGVHKEFYGRGGTYERVAGQRAGGGDKSIKAKASEYAEALVDAKAVNPTTKKPYTVEEAKQYALGVVLKDPNAKTKSEWKTVSGNPDLQENAEGVQREWNATTNTWKIRGVPEVSANGSKLGVVADIRDGQVGYKGKGGWYSTEQEAVESFSTPAASDKAPSQASALPTGTRAELRTSADKIDAEIAALRRSVTARTPIQERTAIGDQISALQARRSDTLKAWAKTPGVGIDSGAAYPVPRP